MPRIVSTTSIPTFHLLKHGLYFLTGTCRILIYNLNYVHYYLKEGIYNLGVGLKGTRL
jgi:hypothetical protein